MSLRYLREDNIAVQHYVHTDYYGVHKKMISRPVVELDTDKGPFYGISTGLSGKQYQDIWDTVTTLYANNIYDIVEDAFSTMDLSILCRHPKFKNETPESLKALMGSFMTTERIERTKHLTDTTVGIEFTVLSTYRTFSNDSIRLKIHTIIRYRPAISWQVLTPSFYIGD